MKPIKMETEMPLRERRDHVNDSLVYRRLGGWRENTHGSCPSTSGKTNEKPSVIQTRCRQCTTFLFFLPFNPLHLVRDQRNIILKGVPKRVAAS